MAKTINKHTAVSYFENFLRTAIFNIYFKNNILNTIYGDE